MVWWLTCFAWAPRPLRFNICIAFYALQVYGWCIIVLLYCVCTALVSGVTSGNWGSLDVRVAWTGNLTTLKLTSIKSVRRARAVLGDSETQDSWWCDDAHPPDMGRPTYGSARMVYVGWPQLQESALDRKYSSIGLGPWMEKKINVFFFKNML